MAVILRIRMVSGSDVLVLSEEERRALDSSSEGLRLGVGIGPVHSQSPKKETRACNCRFGE